MQITKASSKVEYGRAMCHYSNHAVCDYIRLEVGRCCNTLSRSKDVLLRYTSFPGNYQNQKTIFPVYYLFSYSQLLMAYRSIFPKC